MYFVPGQSDRNDENRIYGKSIWDIFCIQLHRVMHFSELILGGDVSYMQCTNAQQSYIDWNYSRLEFNNFLGGDV